MRQFYTGCVLIVLALLLLFFSVILKGPYYYYVISVGTGIIGYFVVKDAPYEN